MTERPTDHDHQSFEPLAPERPAGDPDVASVTDLTGEEVQARLLTATFSDPGDPGPHTAVIDWGDGSTSAGSVRTSWRPRCSFPATTA